MMNVLVNLTLVIVLQCTHTSYHHAVHLKYTQFLFVNYTSMKLERKGSIYLQRCGQGEMGHSRDADRPTDEQYCTDDHLHA